MFFFWINDCLSSLFLMLIVSRAVMNFEWQIDIIVLVFKPILKNSVPRWNIIALFECMAYTLVLQFWPPLTYPQNICIIYQMLVLWLVLFDLLEFTLKRIFKMSVISRPPCNIVLLYTVLFNIMFVRLFLSWYDIPQLFFAIIVLLIGYCWSK